MTNTKFNTVEKALKKVYLIKSQRNKKGLSCYIYPPKVLIGKKVKLVIV